MKVTIARINEVISSEWYTTADRFTPTVAQGFDHVRKNVADYTSLSCLTICVLVLKNGFTVLGKSACTDPTEFDKATGERYAREDAVGQIWALEGYLLKQGLFEKSTKGESNGQ
jgi:Phage protein (N4 Gp49/phage Sf6 gene 66) family